MIYYHWLIIGISAILLVGCSQIIQEEVASEGIFEQQFIADSGRHVPLNADQLDTIQMQELVDERGIGGSGRHDPLNADRLETILVDERGIGGSGRRDLLNADQLDTIQVQELVDERGIGGSGRRLQWLAQLQSGEKIGVLGTINAFGSIWVNGLRIHYSADTPVTIDGKSISGQQIRLGQRAVLTAQRRNGLLIADSIELINAVIGPVTKVDLNRAQFTILGQKIKLQSATVNNLVGAGLPEVGDWLQIAGLRDAQQNILASSITAAAAEYRAQNKVLVRGQINRTKTGFRIGAKNFTLPSDRFLDKDFVVLSGQLPSPTAVDNLRALSVKPVLSFMSRPNVKLLSIERSADTQQQPGPYGPKTSPSQQVHGKLQVIDIQRKEKSNLVKYQGKPKAVIDALNRHSPADRRDPKAKQQTPQRPSTADQVISEDSVSADRTNNKPGDQSQTADRGQQERSAGHGGGHQDGASGGQNGPDGNQDGRSGGGSGGGSGGRGGGQGGRR